MPTTSIHDILQQLRAVAFDKRDMGNRFELLMQAFLRLEPQYATLYSDVWLWNEYPERGTRVDTGIDLVAKDAVTGELTAIQCKFYSESTPVSKGDIDSFLAASSKKEFAARLIISTSDNWGKNAEDAVENQNPPVQRLRVQDLDESSIDWSQFEIARPNELIQKAKKTPFPHQRIAISKVIDGFASNDRGKLIMACGTGKTFTALQIAQDTVRPGGTVLFLVPSISLLSQTLKEWTIEAESPIRSYAVCSDVSVGKRNDDEDIPITDLAYPATTNAAKLVSKFSERDEPGEGLTVVFSTYQSIDVINQAQKLGLPEFDLIICDEAHRTTGVTLSGDDESAFVRIHNAKYIAGKKRLYMTATPRIYNDASKSKAEQAGALLTDMDKFEDYGPEFHRLGFGEAVSIGRLTDYKVLVLAVDENYISKRFQGLLADEDNSLALEDAAKIVGCWNGLSKRSLSPTDFETDPEPMKRAVAFARNIKESKKLAEMFEQVISAEIDAQSSDEPLLECEVHHVDGTYNVLERNRELDWLKMEPGIGKARVLTNARCLSEGVDVPALDAVMFLNPRDSVVDVVQSVGRVMRKLEGKKYGYVILPIAVPTDVPADVALSDNKKYKVVWQVLQALRAHDERFDAMVNKIDLTKDTENKLSIIGVGGSPAGTDKEDFGQVAFEFPNLDEYKDAILARIVDKVGERRYWEKWAIDVANIAKSCIVRISTLVSQSNSEAQTEFKKFVSGLQDNLNPSVSEADAIEMLAQHLITQPVFDALFEDFRFSEENPVSQVMTGMLEILEKNNLHVELESLDKFYESVRFRAAGITSAEGRQRVIKELYETFFRYAFQGTAERLGIVYTPVEIVDFMVRATNDVLKKHFVADLGSKGVHVLDPFTGTGTYMVRLLQSGLISADDLEHKFKNELHANEIVLLAYYVAAINIEETYYSISGKHKNFPGIILTDTFQMLEGKDRLDINEVFQDNNHRVVAQNDLDIRVIIGNPPYSVGSKSGNDLGIRETYEDLDASIASTYVARSNASQTKSLFDSYMRAFRWATNRLKDQGVVCFVTNGAWLDSKSADGFRASLVEEFSHIYVLNLRGNQRTMGEASRREGGKVFGEGSRTPVAIAILVKDGSKTQGQISYHDIGDYLSREEKLKLVEDFQGLDSVPWVSIEPNQDQDWINQRTDLFASFIPLAVKKGDHSEIAIFDTHSRGVLSARDAWAYNFSSTALGANMSRMISFYETQIGETSPNTDGSLISWDGTLLDARKRGKFEEFDESNIRPAFYKPFIKSNLYLSKLYNNSVYRIPEIFPKGKKNIAIVLPAPGDRLTPSSYITDRITDIALPGISSQVFPLYKYAGEPSNSNTLFDVDDSTEYAITDQALELFQNKYGVQITKEDIFYYVYGIVSHPQYQEEFAADLKKVLARVPLVESFSELSAAGRDLAALHLGYEKVDEYPLEEVRPELRATIAGDNKVTKLAFKSRKDKTEIVVNSHLSLRGIPLEAYDYQVMGKSPLDWLVERILVKQDPTSGIVNDPNTLEEAMNKPDYYVSLIKKLVTVSVQTQSIKKSLKPLF